jgi:hypothetical protein
MSSPLPYCRTNQTSSDVGMIGMITGERAIPLDVPATQWNQAKILQ